METCPGLHACAHDMSNQLTAVMSGRRTRKSSVKHALPPAGSVLLLVNLMQIAACKRHMALQGGWGRSSSCGRRSSRLRCCSRCAPFIAGASCLHTPRSRSNMLMPGQTYVKEQTWPEVYSGPAPGEIRQQRRQRSPQWRSAVKHGRSSAVIRSDNLNSHPKT